MIDSRLTDLCRCCLSDGATVPLESDIIQRLNTCFSLTVKTEPDLPNKLCDECSTRISESFDFYKKIANVERALTEVLKESISRDNEPIRKRVLDRFEYLNKDEIYVIRQILVPFENVARQDKKGETPQNVKTALKLVNNALTSEAIETDHSKNIRILPKIAARERISSEIEKNLLTGNKLEVSLMKSCSVCNINFPNHAKLTQHNLKVHFPPSKSCSLLPLSCDICNRKFKYKHLLARHEKRLHSTLPSEKHVCGHCDRNCYTLYELQMHQKSCQDKTEASIKNVCKLCKMVFNNVEDLDNHMETHNANLCEYCNKGFVSVALLLCHISDEHNTNKNPYMCIECDKTYSTKRILLQHQRLKHKYTLETFYCGHCKLQNFFKLKELWNHIQTFHLDSLTTFNDISDKCTVVSDLNAPIKIDTAYITFSDIKATDKLSTECPDENNEFQDYTISDFVDIRSNVREDENSIKPIDSTEMIVSEKEENCINNNIETSIENSLFFNDTLSENVNKMDVILDSSNSLLKSSIDSTDEPISKVDEHVECKICFKKFSRLLTLQKHMKSHKNAMLTCVACDFTAENQSTLKQHIKQCTTFWRLNNLACSTCGKKLFTTAGLKYHLKTHANIKKYSCPRCLRTFLTLSNLRTHVQTVHSDVKPHACSFCPRTFASTNHQRKHIKIAHLRQRDHLCGICDRKFAQKSHLSQHEWIHTGVKPYKCPYCSNNYTAKCSLNKHLQRIHKTQQQQQNEKSINKDEKTVDVSDSKTNQFVNEINEDLLEDIDVVIVSENGEYSVENIVEYGKRFKLDFSNMKTKTI